jgi:hypothetical protein
MSTTRVASSSPFSFFTLDLALPFHKNIFPVIFLPPAAGVMLQFASSRSSRFVPDDKFFRLCRLSHPKTERNRALKMQFKDKVEAIKEQFDSNGND